MKKTVFSAHLLGAVAIASFIPFKIYPLIYLGVAIVFIMQGMIKKITLSLVYLLFFVLYAVIVYLLNWGVNDDATLAIVKLIVNSILFGAVVRSSLLSAEVIGNSKEFLKIVELYLRVCLILSLVQILFLQLQSGGIRFKADSSYEAGLMFTDFPIFWGVDDKNIFGAKLALFGFLHSLMRYKLKGYIGYGYAMIFLLASFMTLSRTALLFSAGAFALLVLYSIRAKIIYFLLIPIVIGVGIGAYPYISELVRFDSIKDGNMDDGMGIRLAYWDAFFSNMNQISIWGNGLLNAEDFLGKYSAAMIGHNLHNIFFNTYLDMGILGVIFYSLFLIYAFKDAFVNSKVPYQVIVIALPLWVMINTLYTAYDNDVWVYLVFMYVLSISYDSRFHEIYSKKMMSVPNTKYHEGGYI